jgi:hypothetical protein
MNVPDINNYLLKEDLFSQFRAQLKKDFEGSGINSEFTNVLPQQFDALRECILSVIESLTKQNSSLLSSLLYRVDISENQLHKYQEKSTELSFEEIVSELIIKRILQKVILKRSFFKE